MKDLLSRDANQIWHPFTPLSGSDPIAIESAKGVYLNTTDGRQIIDAVSSWWVNIHGHSNEVIADAIYKQAKTLEHVIFAGFTHEPAVKLSDNLLTILPSNQKRIFFSDDGSTSVEVGLKLAIQYWANQGIDKKKIVALSGAYHGDTFGAMSTGDRNPFNAPFQPFLFDVEFLPFPGTDGDAALDKFEKIANTGEVAAFIFEPLIQGAGGMRMYSPEILNNLMAIASKNEIICVADEVMTGFGRTGKYFATNHIDFQPDIMCLSKGITGGTMALGVTTCNSRIESAFEEVDFTKTFFHGHSYTANPIACAAANASHEILISDECQGNIARISEQHELFISSIKEHERISDSRYLGTICALEISDSESSYFSDLRKKIFPYFMSRNLLLRPLGNVIYVMPPYVISDQELNIIYSAITDFLDEV